MPCIGIYATWRLACMPGQGRCAACRHGGHASAQRPAFLAMAVHLFVVLRMPAACQPPSCGCVAAHHIPMLAQCGLVCGMTFTCVLVWVYTYALSNAAALPAAAAASAFFGGMASSGTGGWVLVRGVHFFCHASAVSQYCLRAHTFPPRGGGCAASSAPCTAHPGVWADGVGCAPTPRHSV